MDLEPIPQTRAACDELDPPDDGLLDELVARARRVQQVVPDCVGLSLGGLEHGVTFTLAATSPSATVVDAGDGTAGGDDHLSEEAWRELARSTAAAGVASSLTLPILVDELVVGTVNLYGAAPGSFDGHHQQVAEIFSAWAPGAVTNADLSFDTRHSAERAPAELRARHKVSAALGILAAHGRLSLEAARAALEAAARRAGVDVAELADAIIAVVQERRLE